MFYRALFFYIVLPRQRSTFLSYCDVPSQLTHMGVGSQVCGKKKKKIYRWRGDIYFLTKHIRRKCYSETLSKSNYHVDNYLKTLWSWMSWCVPVIPVFGRLKRDHNEFKASLSYTARCCLKSPVGLPEFMKSSFSFLAVLSSSWGHLVGTGYVRREFIVEEKGKMYSILPQRIIMFWENLTRHPASCWYPDGMGKPDHGRSHTSQKSILRPFNPPAGFRPRCGASSQLYTPTLKQALGSNLYRVMAVCIPYRRSGQRASRGTRLETPTGWQREINQVPCEISSSGYISYLPVYLKYLKISVPLSTTQFKTQTCIAKLKAEQTNPGLSLSVWSLKPKRKQAHREHRQEECLHCSACL